MGYTVPDPNTKEYVGDVEVPYGKPVAGGSKSVLLYNEYPFIFEVFILVVI